MRKLTPTEFARLAQSGEWRGTSVTRLALAGTATNTDSGVIVDAIMSNSAIARDGHRVITSGIDTSGFERNPVCTYAHDTAQPPVGRWIRIWRDGDNLCGRVQFTPEGLNPFGAQVGRMYAEGYLNAFSIAWLPVEFKFATERNRPGGIDFTKVDLLECSAVSVPTLESALVSGRGISRNRNGRTIPASRLLAVLQARRALFYQSSNEFIERVSP